jgi:hypothetical protein
LGHELLARKVPELVEMLTQARSEGLRSGFWLSMGPQRGLGHHFVDHPELLCVLGQ